MSLHQIITACGNDVQATTVSLAVRFHIAQDVAKSIGQFRTDSWLHKSISSHVIIFLSDAHHSLRFFAPYITGFDYSRPLNALTQATYDEDTEKNLYRHPDRQGLPEESRQKPFSKLYDLYALGVVLLEIGLWKTAKECQVTGAPNNGGRQRLPHGTALKDLYISLARDHLARMMGLNYQAAVLACLEGELEPELEEDSFGIKFYGEVVEGLDMRHLLEEV